MGMKREVIVIPATVDNRIYGNSQRLLKVASYSRVSTDFEEQLTSFHTQKSYYTEMILGTPGWKLAGTYADEGISGASAEKRPDFMKMIRHCKQGKIDLVVTKSISRFARNTMDSIGYVRKLKAIGVGVLFEKENINTLEENSEVVLTILSSLAQEELNSMSMNIKMGRRMAMQEGKVNFGKLYGYEVTDNVPKIIPEQAEVVTMIFNAYLAGQSVASITTMLNDNGIKRPGKNPVWRNNTIRGMLLNEKFCGDIIMQKTFVSDPISKRTIKNTGQLPKVCVRNNHPAIVSREVFESVAQEMTRRGSKRKVSAVALTEQGKYSAKYALTEILVCAECGTPYKRVQWTKRNGEKQIVWRCHKRIDHGRKYCRDSVSVDEKSLHEAIMTAIYRTTDERNNIVSMMTQELENVMWQGMGGKVNTHEIEEKIERLKTEVADIVAQDPGSVALRMEELKGKSDEARRLTDILTVYKASESRHSIETKVSKVVEYVEQTDPTQYDDSLVRNIIHTIKVVDEYTLKIYFRSGYECEQTMECGVRRLYKA